MKTNKYLLIKCLSIAFFSILSITAFGQTERQARDIKDFTSIEVGGSFQVIYQSADQYSLEIETEPKNFEDIITEVNGNTLKISSKRTLKDFSKLNVYVSAPLLEAVKVSGAANFSTSNLIKSPAFKLTASGATSTSIDLETQDLTTKVSGAADVFLRGNANIHNSEVSGASTLKAGDLATNETRIEASGASDAFVYASEKLSGTVSGASDLKYSNEPAVNEIAISGAGSINGNDEEDEEDEEEVELTEELEIEDGDTTKVKIGSKKFVYVDDDKPSKKTKRKFDGHWGGVELGINGYLAPEYKLELGSDADYLDLRYNKSFAVNINIYEQNINLIRNHLGLITGLGIGYNNYRFLRDVTLNPDEDVLEYSYSTTDFTKNKLTASYLHIPVILEFQTHGKYYQRFHIGGGAIFGARLGTHTKQVYEQDGRKMKDKVYDDFHLSPFKADLTARIGWGNINLFANYSLIPLFRENKGPELYPFTVGISLVSW